MLFEVVGGSIILKTSTYLPHYPNGKEPDLKSGDASRHCRFESCVRRSKERCYMEDYSKNILLYLMLRYRTLEVKRVLSRKIAADLGQGVTKPRFRILKGIGYNFSFVKKKIDMGKPITIFIKNKIPVLVIGYEEYQMSNGKVKKFLLIQNDSLQKIAFIDYNNVGRFSYISY